ncbi:receptor subunit 1 [Seminavis robusta]|uniref:Receptor subunit 1 n=1 Tax=Seminavis robusta TaxID=568900 RepID=A0A9N8HA55_9STRA|nr:receptor subunit 1 [Seminavis robusta]|eukprot:Sro280_g107140.1 receptor subunit 1 (633) ;mRNA; f:72110-74065
MMFYNCQSLLWCLLVLHLVSWSEAQESPSINVTTFSTDESLRARQDVCDRYQLYDRGEVELRLALKGLTLRPLFTKGSFFNLDQDTNQLDEANPGLAAVLMDELARRAGFTWRNSYGITEGPPPGSGKTWTNLLLWGTDYFDVYCDWYAKTLARLKLGISFPEGFYDSSYILVGVAEAPPDNSINLWQWLEPFDTQVWICIVITIIGSGVLHQILDHIPPARQHKRRPTKPTFNEYRSRSSLSNHNNINTEEIYEGAHTIGDGIFLSSLLFTQHFQFMPRTAPSRLFSASMGLWALLINSNYTANLASFFVIENTPQLAIQSIDDAIAAGFPLCVWKDTASHEYVKDTYPQAKFIEANTELELYQAIVNGDCPVGVSSVQAFQLSQNQKQFNPDCGLYWVGRIIEPVNAGFSVKADAGNLCTSLIHNVLNLHLVEMKVDGFIDAAWEKEREKTNDQNCASDQNASSDDTSNSGSRSIKEMAGTFVLHSAFGAAAVLLMIVMRLRDKYKQMSDQSRQELHNTVFSVRRRPHHTKDDDYGMPDNDIMGPDHDHSNRLDHSDHPAREQQHVRYGGVLTTEERFEELKHSMRKRQDELEQTIQEQLGTILDLLQKQQQRPEQCKNEWRSKTSSWDL